MNTRNRGLAHPMPLPGLEAALHPALRKAGWRGAVRHTRARKGPSPAPRPWEVVVLAGDTARVTGWSVWKLGKYYASGELDTLDQASIERVVLMAVTLARELNVPCVLVLEAPWGGSVVVVASLGAARERWESVWRRLAVGHKAKIIRVAVSTWRSAMLGKEYAGASKEECRKAEQMMARALSHRVNVGPDEAPGICIGCWGTRAGEIAKLIGKRQRDKSVASWLGGRDEAR